MIDTDAAVAGGASSFGQGAVAMRWRDDVVHIELSRPARRNALRAEDWETITRIATQLAGSTARAVVIRGAGGTFCSGADLTEWSGATPAYVNRTFAAMEEAFAVVEALPMPSVATVEGVAAGAGCQLMLACDLRVCSLSARIGMPILRLGIRPSPDFARRLTDSVGRSAARWLLYEGQLVGGPVALKLGLVNRVAADGDLDRELSTVLKRILGQPAAAIAATKQVTSTGVFDADPWVYAGPDTVELVSSFVEAPRGLTEIAEPD